MEIRQNVPLDDKNWFLTGGTAEFYCEPSDEESFRQALDFAQKQGLEVVILGEGANVLISDEGVNGLIIRPRLMQLSYDGGQQILAGAGVGIQAVINYALQCNLTKLEEFSGIPGTVGGSVFINIHYFDAFLSDFLVKAVVIERSTGIVQEVDKEWFDFGYNTTTLHKMNHYLLSATFRLHKEDAVGTAYACGRRDEIIRHRSRRYPTSRTCGSFFRNFLPHEVPFSINGEKLPYVGYYLDKVGVKGSLVAGKAGVSARHANMIVSQPGATTRDIIDVARTMQQVVFDAFGIIPQPECRLLGFKLYPLLSAS